jgi:hypothetical protein
MILHIHSTTKVVKLNGVPARIWEGKTDSGIKVHAYVTRVAVKENENQEQFLVELEQCVPPSPEVEAIPFSLIL